MSSFLNLPAGFANSMGAWRHMLMFLKRQLSRLGDNLSETPNAAIKAEHDIQRPGLFKIVPWLAHCVAKLAAGWSSQ
jgi:hypothetical protein